MSGCTSTLAEWSSAAESDLIVASSVGDDRAFAELYRRYQRRVAGFFLIRGVLYDDVDDCCQLVWMGVCKHLPRFDTSKSFGTWLYTCCLNRYRNYIRDVKKHGCILSLGDTIDESFLRLDDPNDQLDAAITLKGVAETLDQTPDHPGVQALILWSQGYSYDEISEIQTSSNSAVKMRLHHTRKKLARLL